MRSDDTVGGGLAARHLVELGHRRLAYAGATREERFEGAAAVAADAGASLLGLTTAGADIEDGVRVAAQLAALPRRGRPTAICCENDLLAVGVVQEARRQGLRVPEDVSVVGYDDTIVASAVGLTTVRQPAAEMGAAAVVLLLEEIASPADHEHRDVVFAPMLVPGLSSGPASGSAGRHVGRAR